jgi:hypothetical protein
MTLKAANILHRCRHSTTTTTATMTMTMTMMMNATMNSKVDLACRDDDVSCDVCHRSDSIRCDFE